MGIAGSVVYSVLVPLSDATGLSGKPLSKSLLTRNNKLTSSSIRLECGHGVPIPPLRLGFVVLATICIAIWETANLPHLGSSHSGKFSSSASG